MNSVLFYRHPRASGGRGQPPENSGSLVDIAGAIPGRGDERDPLDLTPRPAD